MLDTEVKQTKLNDVKNYHEYWSGIVAKVVETIYKDVQTYVSAYQSNSKKVFTKINSVLRVVPFDLKFMLYTMYWELLPQFTPDDGPRRGTA